MRCIIHDISTASHPRHRAFTDVYDDDDQDAKIINKSTPNRHPYDPKSTRMGTEIGPWSPLGGVWGPSWHQERARPEDAPKKSHKNEQKIAENPLSLGKLAGKIEQNPAERRPRSSQKSDQFLHWFLDGFWIHFGRNLDGFSAQIETKLEPCWLPKAIQEAKSKNM